MPRKKSRRNPEAEWVPCHAIRKTPDGGIQILTERGVMSNPRRRKGYLAKVRGLFTKGTRGIRKVLGNPKRFEIRYKKQSLTPIYAKTAKEAVRVAKLSFPGWKKLKLTAVRREIGG